MAGSLPAKAQNRSQITTDADVARRDMIGAITGQAFAPEPGYAPPSPADPDLGEQRLLIPDQRYQSFTLFSNVSEFYTSNAALSNGGEQSDWFTAMQFGACLGAAYRRQSLRRSDRPAAALTATRTSPA